MTISNIFYVFNMSFLFFSANKCPDHINCVRMRRHFCEHGSSHCGPCFSPFEEDENGHCVAHRRDNPQHHLHGTKVFTHPLNGFQVIVYLAPIVLSGVCFGAHALTNCESGNTQPFSQAKCCPFINQTLGL